MSAQNLIIISAGKLGTCRASKHAVRIVNAKAQHQRHYESQRQLWRHCSTRLADLLAIAFPGEIRSFHRQKEFVQIHAIRLGRTAQVLQPLAPSSRRQLSPQNALGESVAMQETLCLSRPDLLHDQPGNELLGKQRVDVPGKPTVEYRENRTSNG